ncbi:enoyl-CoA hydratase/isomerase family protein [Jatrophihabitans fulvus]
MCVPPALLPDVAGGPGIVDADGRVGSPLVVVDLDGLDDDARACAAVVSRLDRVSAPTRLLIGRSHGPVPDAWSELLERLTATFVPDAAGRATVGVDDVDAAIARTVAAASLAPRAAATLDGLLRLTSVVPPSAGLIAESSAYSMLLAGPEFARWRASRPVRRVPDTDEAVLLARDGDELHIVLNRPDRHNAYGRAVRDGLLAGLDVADADPDIARVVLSGAGRSFSSGGDLDEFGSSPDVTTAHLVRLERSAADRIVRTRAHVEARLHGACIGAGIEVPSFADHVTARRDAFVQLPELSLGLVPGAGGTVGVTARIGRWRTAYLALTGDRIDAATALRWGLVDAIVD